MPEPKLYLWHDHPCYTVKEACLADGSNPRIDILCLDSHTIHNVYRRFLQKAPHGFHFQIPQSLKLNIAEPQAPG